MAPVLKHREVLTQLSASHNGSSPRLAAHLRATCHDMPALRKRVSVVEEIGKVMVSAGVSSANAVSYAILFPDADSALAKRTELKDKFHDRHGIPCLRAGRMVDSIVTNASLLNQLGHIDTIHAMCSAAFSAGISCRAVCEVVENNMSNGIPRLFARSCIQATRSEGMEPQISEDALLLKLSRELEALD